MGRKTPDLEKDGTYSLENLPKKHPLYANFRDKQFLPENLTIAECMQGLRDLVQRWADPENTKKTKDPRTGRKREDRRIAVDSGAKLEQDIYNSNQLKPGDVACIRDMIFREIIGNKRYLPERLTFEECLTKIAELSLSATDDSKDTEEKAQAEKEIQELSARMQESFGKKAAWSSLSRELVIKMIDERIQDKIREIIASRKAE